MLRPIAGAMIRSSAIRRSNCAGNIDCAPSLMRVIRIAMHFDNQAVGAGGHRRPCHRATMSRRPAPWLGSPTIGRWLSFLTTGIAEMSKVLRVAGLERADPALAEDDVFVAAAQHVLGPRAAIPQIVADMPRLISTGFLRMPELAQQREVCMLRAPTWKMSVCTCR